MKYSVNHSWKFESWSLAYLAGFLQTVSALCVEIANFAAIMYYFEIIDIVMKFMTLIVIATFGQIFYNAYDEEEWKQVITHKGKYEDFFTIQTSTSQMAEEEIDGNKVKP